MKSPVTTVRLLVNFKSCVNIKLPVKINVFNSKVICKFQSLEKKFICHNLGNMILYHYTDDPSEI